MPCPGLLEVERKMTNKLSSIFVRIAKVFHASNRGRNLLQHGDLAHQFALVAPLGGGAVIALQQALSQPESDHGSLLGAQRRRGRPSQAWAA
jgi:hypothetical protein